MKHIEDFYHNADGNDWLPAVIRAQNQWNSCVGSQYCLKGFSLFFGSRIYRFSDSIPLIRGMSIIGSGGAGWNVGTIFLFPAGTHGIICHSRTTAPENTPGEGDWSIVERIHIEAEDKNDIPAHGIVMNGRISVRDVYITKFSGNGIHISAGHERQPPTNANLWLIENCRVDLCNGNGLYIDGPDANAGVATLLDCSDNQGWAINDESFLGNTFIACHADHNAAGAYRCLSNEGNVSNSKSLFLNCYTEGVAPSEIFAPAMVIGGRMNVVGTGIWLDAEGNVASFIHSVKGYSRSPSLGISERAFGVLGSTDIYQNSIDNQNVALELHRRVNDSMALKFHYSKKYAGWWEMTQGNTNNSPIRFSTDEATDLDTVTVGDCPYGNIEECRRGHVWMENGYYIGVGTNHRVRVSAGTSPPPHPDFRGPWKAGDRVLNSNPQVGNYAEWICIEENGVLVWRGINII